MAAMVATTWSMPPAMPPSRSIAASTRSTASTARSAIAASAVAWPAISVEAASRSWLDWRAVSTADAARPAASTTEPERWLASVTSSCACARRLAQLGHRGRHRAEHGAAGAVEILGQGAAPELGALDAGAGGVALGLQALALLDRGAQRQHGRRHAADLAAVGGFHRHGDVALRQAGQRHRHAVERPEHAARQQGIDRRHREAERHRRDHQHRQAGRAGGRQCGRPAGRRDPGAPCRGTRPALRTPPLRDPSARSCRPASRAQSAWSPRRAGRSPAAAGRALAQYGS